METFFKEMLIPKPQFMSSKKWVVMGLLNLSPFPCQCMWKRRKPQYGIFIHISVVKSQFSFVINCSKIVHAWHNPLKKELVKPPQGDFGITPPNLSTYVAKSSHDTKGGSDLFFEHDFVYGHKLRFYCYAKFFP